MGQSSFTDANDKNRSIAQCTSEHPDSEKTAYFLLPGGSKVEEVTYDGYCHFDNIDAFEWLAETNGLSGGRNAGIHAFYNPEVYQTLTFPLKITYDPDATYEQSGVSFDCPHQGLPPRPDKAIAFAAGADPFLVDDEVYLGKVLLHQQNRIIGRLIVGHPYFSKVATSFDNNRKKFFQKFPAIII